MPRHHAVVPASTLRAVFVIQSDHLCESDASSQAKKHGFGVSLEIDLISSEHLTAWIGSSCLTMGSAVVKSLPDSAHSTCSPRANRVDIPMPDGL